MADQPEPVRIDTSRPHPARMYDYYLGGKDNFQADREAAEQAIRGWPALRTAARANRAFLGRAVRFLAGEAGIRQFLDIGTGLPNKDNVHEVAQRIDPACRVVYVDNDPIVLAHARSLLTSTPEGRTAYVDADLRDPEKILAEARATLDFDRPIALMLVAVLHFMPDEYGPRRIVQTLVDELPSGSYVAATHVTSEFSPEVVANAGEAYRRGGIPGQDRGRAEIHDLVFAGLELVEPGLVVCSEWRPDPGGERPAPAEVACYGGVARKP
ncbi:SAM-dependent methyltransferase [Thermomonospora cellulosilytica]|uniref:O-methyltransferase involved in polyketide biosynthesis n=1 Tax=Thermomonospora cellulosilytica TaxID=1411118 RepID=A0A7W3RC90_9ACTN|nr:SAM-dependent methyltransferase [Thermomonospora cellulosilytica]MBA9007065.1 O-methyltransferase involved in polyketide biosynthesis [Thermomonospora cellulosilytica]